MTKTLEARRRHVPRVHSAPLLCAALAALALGAPRAWAQEEEMGEPLPPEGEFAPPEGAEAEPLPPEGEFAPPEGAEAEPPPTAEASEAAGPGDEGATRSAGGVKVTVFIFPEVEMDARVATEVMAGIRRGIRADKRLEWIDPSAAIEASEEVVDELPAQQGAERLAQAVEHARAGRWRTVVSSLDDAIELFESDLANVQRQDLVDATMLWGAAQCEMRRTRVCESAFRRVVTFRENASYDTDVLPRGPEQLFEQIRDDTLEGPRGSLNIETEPPGAEIFVDGRFVGASPSRAEGLLAGDHYVTLKMVGYERQVQRVTVRTDFEDTATFELVQMENFLGLQHSLEAAQNEMGQPRAGNGIRGLRGLLLIDQVVLGALSRIEDSDEFNVVLYLYDLRTNHGLRRLERRINWEAQDLTSTEELAAELYRNIDLTGRIRPVDDPLPPLPVEPAPFYRTWWFWSIVGAVIVGTSIGVASAVAPAQVPEGVTRLDIPF
jgi:hypothetical protein